MIPVSELKAETVSLSQLSNSYGTIRSNLFSLVSVKKLTKRKIEAQGKSVKSMMTEVNCRRSSKNDRYRNVFSRNELGRIMVHDEELCKFKRMNGYLFEVLPEEVLQRMRAEEKEVEREIWDEMRKSYKDVRRETNSTLDILKEMVASAGSVEKVLQKVRKMYVIYEKCPADRMFLAEFFSKFVNDQKNEWIFDLDYDFGDEDYNSEYENVPNGQEILKGFKKKAAEFDKSLEKMKLDSVIGNCSPVVDEDVTKLKYVEDDLLDDTVKSVDSNVALVHFSKFGAQYDYSALSQEEAVTNTQTVAGIGDRVRSLVDVRKEIRNIESNFELLKRNKDLAVDVFSLEYTFCGGLDTVRCVAFPPTMGSGSGNNEYVLAGGDDCFVSMYSMNRKKLLGRRKNLFETIHTFRSHRGPITSIILEEDYFMTSSFDQSVMFWKIPPKGGKTRRGHNKEKIGKFMFHEMKDAHSDIIWSIEKSHSASHFLSIGADQAIKYWKYQVDLKDDKVETEKLFTLDEKFAPTSMKFLPNDSSKFVVSYTDSTYKLFDVEKQVAIFTKKTIEKSEGVYDSFVYKILPLSNNDKLLVTCHEDKRARIWDINSGKLAVDGNKIMHVDSVSCCAESPYQNVLATATHGCNVRIWDMRKYTILQDFSAGRTKGHEGLHTIVYHPWRNYTLATGGSDGCVKMFYNNRKPAMTEEEKVYRKIILDKMAEEKAAKEKAERRRRRREKKRKKKKRRDKKKRRNRDKDQQEVEGDEG